VHFIPQQAGRVFKCHHFDYVPLAYFCLNLRYRWRNPAAKKKPTNQWVSLMGSHSMKEGLASLDP
jgi:hypothetical protein